MPRVRCNAAVHESLICSASSPNGSSKKKLKRYRSCSLQACRNIQGRATPSSFWSKTWLNRHWVCEIFLDVSGEIRSTMIYNSQECKDPGVRTEREESAQKDLSFASGTTILPFCIVAARRLVCMCVLNTPARLVLVHLVSSP